MVTEARDRGLPAFAETCPQYLFLSYDNYEEPGFEGSKYVMSPPLRAKATQDKLWRGLAFNDLQAIATDHCPFCMKEKHLGDGDFSKIPNGAPGVETRMSLVYDGGVRKGKISMNRFVSLPDVPRRFSAHVPEEGHDRARLRRRHRHLRSGGEDDALREDASHEGGLQPL
jgi:dihydropyrimidinase